MNPTTLLDEMHGSIVSKEVTSSPEYEDLFWSMLQGRRSWTMPTFVNLMLSFSILCMKALKQKGKSNLSTLSNHQITIFANISIEHHFPAIVLAESPSSNRSFIWGYTWVGIQSVNNEKIYLNGSVIEFWLRRSYKKKRISAEKLSLIIASTIFHELAHYLTLWWSQGHCRTPVIEPVSEEGGNFIELRIFGGVVMGWWRENEIGNFRRLREIGVMTRSAPKFFNHKTAMECLSKLSDKDAILPFLDPESLPDSGSKTRRLVHAKVNAEPREIQRIKSTFKPYEYEDPGAGLGLIGVPLITNDTFIRS